MKKTLFSIIALVCIAQTSYADAYYTDTFVASNGTIKLTDVATFHNDAFAISFELDRSLTAINSSTEFFRLVLSGSSDTYQVTIAAIGNVMTMGVGNNATAGFTMSAPDTSGPFVLQIENGGVATLLYNNNGSLETIMESSSPVYNVPEVVNSATLTFTNGVVEANNITTWTGVVTAEDLANPTPAPSIPEPATATLSLLALAGLAARRRRK